MHQLTLNQKIITDPRAAKLLLNEEERSFVSLFFETPRSVAELASELAEDPRRLLYRVNKLQNLNLLRVVKEEKRAGRPIKYYQTSARRFIVTYAASPAASAVEFIGMMSDSLLREAFYENILPRVSAHRMGAAISYDDKGSLARFALLQDGVWQLPDISTRPFLLWFDKLVLSDSDIEALKGELLELLRKYWAKETQGPPSAILRLGLVKIHED